MAGGEKGTVALVWAQFAAYHVDRCEAVAARLAGRWDVLALEVATTSRDYAWEASGAVAGARKVTLFPGQAYEAVPKVRRWFALFGALRRCRVACLGLSYAEPTTVLLSWALMLVGVRVLVFSESKFDDRPRRLLVEWLKSLVLLCYRGAIVGATRHIAYFRLLGFRRRPVLPGYDTVNLARVLEQGGGVRAPEGAPFAERPFVFVGRFVDKKNLAALVRAYASYATAAGSAARRLVLVGGGPDETVLRSLVAELGLGERVEFTGFLGAEAVSQHLAGALALVLPSVEEQWGLVVNEALAFGLPAIVSHEVGARDALVRNLVNGFVVESGSAEGIAAALTAMSESEDRWRAMVAASGERAWLADTARLADALELVLDPGNADAAANVARYLDCLEIVRR